jgi:hypothetical protein
MTVKTIAEEARQTEVDHDVDVAVVGGGTAGCMAAIAAARTGATTVLIERFGTLGGCPTVGRCAHLGNRFIDENKDVVLGGITVELMKRLAAEGGTRYPTFEETVMGKSQPPVHILVDPEILSIVLLEMAHEAGVTLMLHTVFCDVLMEGENVSGVVVQNKSGRKAVLAKCLVDASGEADVAFAAGVPCQSDPLHFGMESSYALLMRMGNVDHEKFMNFVLKLPAGEARPEFDDWMVAQTGMDIEDLRAEWYWRFMLDPQPVDEGVPRNHAGKSGFTQQSLDWYRERWEAERDFSYVEMHFFREQIKKAVDDGAFDLFQLLDDVRQVGINYDGVTGNSWRAGEVIINGITMVGFDPFDSSGISDVELFARKRALRVAQFMKGYIPGFEDAFLVDTGAQTLPRHIRTIEARFSLTRESLQQTKGYGDAVFLTTYDDVPGIAHQVPYGMMLPKEIGHLLVAGKCTDGAALIRDIPSMMTMGHAAGTAAALASKAGVSPARVDIGELQSALQAQGIILSL